MRRWPPAGVSSCPKPLATEMVVKSVIEGIHFYKTEKSQNARDPEKVHETGKLRGAYRKRIIFTSSCLRRSLIPQQKAFRRFSIGRKEPTRARANPAQFIQTKIVEKLDKQGFIDGLYKK